MRRVSLVWAKLEGLKSIRDGFWEQWIDHFLPDKFLDQDAEVILRVRIFLGFCLGMFVASLMALFFAGWIHITRGIPKPSPSLYVLCVAPLLYLGAYLHFRKYQSLTVSSIFLCVGVSCLNFGLTYFTGGLQSPLFYWNLFLIALVMFLASKRWGFFLVAIILLELLGLYVLSIYGYDYKGFSFQKFSSITLVFTTALFLIVGSFMGWIYLLSRKRAFMEREASLAAKRQAEVARDAAELANKAKSEFLAVMSHELRTPLNAILGYTEMLQEDFENMETADILRDLGKIRLAGEHLLALINDVLDLSRIEAGKMELYPESFTCGDLLSELQSTLQALFVNNGNAFQISCPNPKISLFTDHVRLRQCLINLLGNAAKFTKDGSVTLRTAPCMVRGAEGLLFEVEDTGIGMPPERVDSLFSMFTQADASTTRRYGGTGLGLAITKRLCTMLGGEISATSEPGVGSTFYLKVPLSWKPTSLVRQESEAKPARSSQNILLTSLTSQT